MQDAKKYSISTDIANTTQETRSWFLHRTEGCKSCV